MIILRSVVIEQPDFQWQFQLRHERDVTAQLEAIAALQKYPTPATRMALTDTIENNNCFYKVRCRAAHCLKEVRLVVYLRRVIYSNYFGFQFESGGQLDGNKLDRTTSDAANFSQILRFFQCTAHNQTEQFRQPPIVLSAKDDSCGNGRPSDGSRHMPARSDAFSIGPIQIQRQHSQSLLRQLLQSSIGGCTR